MKRMMFGIELVLLLIECLGWYRKMIPFIPLLIAIPMSIFWLWMLVDLTNHPYLSRESKNNWFLWFILLNFFGALWYYLVEYRNRHK